MIVHEPYLICHRHPIAARTLGRLCIQAYTAKKSTGLRNTKMVMWLQDFHTCGHSSMKWENHTGVACFDTMVPGLLVLSLARGLAAVWLCHLEAMFTQTSAPAVAHPGNQVEFNVHLGEIVNMVNMLGLIWE
jgi:hypothetical protein